MAIFGPSQAAPSATSLPYRQTPGDMVAVLGGSAKNAAGATLFGAPVFEIGAGANFAAAGNLWIPAAATVDVTLTWSELGTGAGNIVYRFDYVQIAPGEDFDVPPTQVQQVVAAPAVHGTMEQTVMTTSVSLDANHWLMWHMWRLGSDGADTCSSSTGFHDLLIAES